MAGSASLDGPVSRYLNRRVSVPIASALAHTPITPNQVSVAAFAISLGALWLLAVGRNIEAGVLIQALGNALEVVDLARQDGSEQSIPACASLSRHLASLAARG